MILNELPVSPSRIPYEINLFERTPQNWARYQGVTGRVTDEDGFDCVSLSILCFTSMR
jgi:hypothetical protein